MSKTTCAKQNETSQRANVLKAHYDVRSKTITVFSKRYGTLYHSAERFRHIHKEMQNEWNRGERTGWNRAHQSCCCLAISLCRCYALQLYHMYTLQHSKRTHQRVQETKRYSKSRDVADLWSWTSGSNAVIRFPLVTPGEFCMIEWIRGNWYKCSKSQSYTANLVWRSHGQLTQKRFARMSTNAI